MKAIQVGVPFIVLDKQGREQEMVVLQVKETDNVFCVLASYLEQEVDKLVSPYNNGDISSIDGKPFPDVSHP